MSRVTEKEVYRVLLEYAGESGPIKIGKTELRISLKPQDIHTVDRPDFIVWLEVSLRILTSELSVKVPILVELEPYGMGEALHDLQEFIERGRYPLELPMLVIAMKGYHTRELLKRTPARITIKQIPATHLEYGTSVQGAFKP